MLEFIIEIKRITPQIVPLLTVDFAFSSNGQHNLSQIGLDSKLQLTLVAALAMYVLNVHFMTVIVAVNCCG